MDDLDCLLSELDNSRLSVAPRKSVVPPAAQVASPSQANRSSAVLSLDDLMASLETSVESTPSISTRSTVVANELDSIMASLGGEPPPPQTSPFTPGPPKVAPPPAPKPYVQPVVSAPPPPPPSTFSNRNNLEDLIASLDEPMAADLPTSVSVPRASAALDTIDDLMASIGGTPAPQPPVQPFMAPTVPQPYVAPKVSAKSRETTSQIDPLDSVLNSLPQGDAKSRPPVVPAASNATVDALINKIANNLGVAPTEPPCGYCGKPVIGESIQAIGRKWHVDHWLCANCQVPLGTAQYFEVSGKPHCVPCHQNLFAPR